ncbi:hypothetical protein ALP29_201866 [Pseudomonas syringae pv. avii]|uniref:Uncharacterized protein n=1 Tax=Pseudomonas syringae pv. avii TaxID=663959 RepID=A0A3M5UAJ6_PSESX|nr:hypothetical protein ALP29_201866 [Pseudomonas syringae pv. avii]
MQQTVRIEGVVDASLALAKRETQLGTALTDGFVNGFDLFRRGAVFLGNVLFDVLAFGRNVRVQFEGLKMNLRLHFVTQRFKRLIQRAQADDAPGAGNIGNEIDLQCSGHDGPR